MFWFRYGYNKDLWSKKQKVSWPSWENEASKVSWVQVLIVLRFGYCLHFESENHLEKRIKRKLIIFLPLNTSIHIQFFKIVNFGSRYQYFWKWKPPWEKNQIQLTFFIFKCIYTVWTVNDVLEDKYPFW